MITKDEYIARLKAQTKPKTHEEWVEELHLKSDSERTYSLKTDTIKKDTSVE